MDNTEKLLQDAAEGINLLLKKLDEANARIALLEGELAKARGTQPPKQESALGGAVAMAVGMLPVSLGDGVSKGADGTLSDVLQRRARQIQPAVEIGDGE